MLLTCAVFDETVQVPTNWVASAETPELHRKINSLWGTAGPRREAVIAAMANDKEKSVSKLAFMDSLIGPETQPKPKPVKSGAAKLVIPPPVSQQSSLSSHSSEELEVFIGFKLLYPLLTNSFSTGDSVTWSLFPQEAPLSLQQMKGRERRRPRRPRPTQPGVSQSAGASLFSEGHTGTPIVAGASPKLHL